MKIVIEIDKEYYNDIKNNPTASNYKLFYAMESVRNAVMDGIVLPEEDTQTIIEASES